MAWFTRTGSPSASRFCGRLPSWPRSRKRLLHLPQTSHRGLRQYGWLSSRPGLQLGLEARFERAGARLVTERDTIAHFAAIIHMRVAVMNSFWRFLRDRRNQQVLRWLGGGLVVAATGLWVAFVYFFPPPKSPETKASQPVPVNVQADCSGIAIGGNVTGATIRTGAMTKSDCASKPK